MKKVVKDYFIIFLGCVVFSLALSAFLIPSQIGAGGVTGIALVINHFTGVKVGLITILVNIPLFVFGYKVIGGKFTIRSGFTVLVSSFLTDFFGTVFKFRPMDDRLLCAIVTGVLLGIAFYLLFVSNSSTGGLDISAKIIQSKFKNINLSTVLLIEDLLVYILLALTFGMETVIYAILMSYVRSKTMDIINENVTASKQCIIITDTPEKIIETINSKLIRGATILRAEGGYSKDDKMFIYVIVAKNQLADLKDIVTFSDPNAFLTVSPVNDVIGNYRQVAKI